MKRRTGITFILLILCLFLSSCGKKGADKSGIRIYYLNKDDHRIQEHEYVPEADDWERNIEKMNVKLCGQPQEMTIEATSNG